MKPIKIITCFIAIINFELIHSFNKFVQSDKELIYSWTANVKAGTYLPVPYASQFVLQGKVHLQTKNDSVLAKITNLTHRIYNGILDEVQEHEASDLPVPGEVADLGNIFRIVYNEQGLVKAIATRKEEKEFSRNIKKAIATILQLNVSVIGEGYHRPESFIVHEKSIYGHGENVYSVFPHENEIEIHKLHKMADDVGLSSFSVRNVEPNYCDVKPEKIVMHGSQKKYFLTKVKESFVIKHIASVGSIFYYPFKAQSESHVILVNQSFQLSDVVPIKEEFHVDLEHLEDSLSYRPFEENPKDLTVDATNGRHVDNYEKLIPLVQNMLKDIPQYLREDHFNTEEPDTKRGQLINRVQRILLRFSIQKLEELQKTLPEESLNIFYHVLPLVGTEASTLLIKNLVSEKKVKDEIAVHMLQRVPEMIKPSLPILHKLEDLIRLDDSFSWEVRKVAILSFGSIVYKSYLNHISTNRANLGENLQKPYEKYADEFIEKMKSSDSYIVQVTYLLGLHNMKLPILADRLVPSFNGEWFQNRHLRLMGIWAASGPIILNPEKFIETFWPIFTNRQELTEIRTLSYYYIIFSRPSFSMLRNIFTYMLTEPDEELYRFHYEFSHSLMQSKEPCHQDVRLKMAQLMKFTPPPARGSSFANYVGYQHEKYGFSAGLQTYLIKTNESRLYALFYTTQQFNIHNENYFLYVKVHDGKDADPGLLATLSNVVNGRCDCHIEASIAKNDQIINMYVVDKTNVHEIINLTDIFFKEVNSSLAKDMLFMSYEKYSSSIIPTDLGIPAFWEYLAPEVHYNKLSIQKELLNGGRDLNFYLENKFGSWMHFRHGLSFYNPISDAWQGINRFHSFDTLLPISVHAVVTDDIKLHWKRHEDLQMNVIGIRSHVKQMVFAKIGEVYDEKTLNKSVLSGKSFQDVAYGKQHRQNFPWFDEILADTGHHVFLGAYDSDQHLSYSVFQNSFSNLANPSTLYFNSPWEYAAAAYSNLFRTIYLQPRPGNYGFLLKIEPSEIIPVSHIHIMWYQVNTTRINTSYEHSCRFTYTAKNQNKILSSWDLRGTFDPDFNDWKYQLTRIIPEEKDYKICVDGDKRWQKKEVEGQLKIRMGESDDQKCVNDTAIEVTMKGQKSQEQIEDNYKDASCRYVGPYSVPFYQNMDCLFRNTTLRHYTFEVNTKNLSNGLKNFLISYWDALRSLYHSHYSYKFNSNDKISDNSFRVDVLYLLGADQLNVAVSTSEKSYEFSEIPTNRLKYFGLAPDSTVYSNNFLKKYETGKIDYCTIHGDHYYINKHYVSEDVPESWKIYLEHYTFSLSLKKVTDKMALKIVTALNTLEIVSDDHGYHTTLNDVVLTSEEEDQDWMYYHVFTEHHHKVVTVFLRRPEVFIKFDGQHVVVIIPKFIYALEGLCLKPATNKTT